MNNGSPGDVANMSLGGGAYSLLDQAIVNAASQGIWFVLAAGNSGDDASNYSPARANGPYVLTVSALDSNGCLTSFSNYGSPVDFAAPGLSVVSLRLGGGVSTKSGTSMAAPHVAGLIASGWDPSAALGNDKVPDRTVCGYEPTGDVHEPIAYRV